MINPRNFFRTITSAILLSLVVPAAGQLEPAFDPASSGIDLPQPILTADLYQSPVGSELVITSVTGEIAIYILEDGRYVQKLYQKLESGLTAPVLGDFTGDRSLEIGAGNQAGDFLIFDTRDLSIIAQQNITNSQPISIPPTVVSLPDPNDNTRRVDVLIAADDTAKVHAVYLDENNRIEKYWEEPVNARIKITAPMSIGHPRGASRTDVVAPTSNGDVVFIDALSGTPTTKITVDRTSIDTSILLVDIHGDSRDELIYVLGNGDFRVDTYPETGGRLTNLFVEQTKSTPVGDPVFVTDGSGTVSTSMIFWAAEKTIYAMRPAGSRPDDWFAVEGNTSFYSGIRTPISLIPKDTGYPRLTLGINSQIAIVDPTPFLSNAADSRPQTYSAGNAMNGALVVGSRGADGGAFESIIIGVESNGNLHAVDAAQESHSLTATPWMTRGGTPLRNNYFARDYHKRDSDRRSVIDSLLTEKKREMDTAVEASDWDAALAAADRRRSLEPFNDEFESDYQGLVIQKNMLNIILGIVGAVLLIGALAFLIIRGFLFGKLRKKALAAYAANDLDSAEPLYETLHQKRPKDKNFIETLAKIYMGRTNYEEKTIPVYQQAFNSFSSDEDKTASQHALAYAMANSNRLDGEAEKVYGDALKTDFPTPSLMHLQYARANRQNGNRDQAVEAYHASIKAEKTAVALQELSEIYLSEEKTDEVALTVYDDVFQERQNDPRFLETYLDAGLNARRSSKDLEALCYRVLDRNPDYIVAALTLAEGYLENGEPGRAIDEAKRALNTDPGYMPALLLLGKCYLKEGRKDEEARATYEGILTTEPDHPEFLKALVEILYFNSEFAGDAVQYYHKSFEKNQNDPTTLKALARVAKLSTDHELSIRVVEPLIKTGHSENEHVLQLANAYVTLKKVEPRSEKVLRDALRVDRNNERLISALARLLAEQGRDDMESLVIFENHLELEPDDKEVSVQLVKAYAAANQSQEALDLAGKLKEIHPNDSLVENVVAFAQLQGNKLDDAVSEYESILQRDPNNEDARLHLAEAYAFKMKTDENAPKLYEQALRISPDNPTILLAMARVQMERNDTVKAIENYQTFIKSCPNQEDRLVTQVIEALEVKPDAIRIRWFLCEVLVGYGRLREAMEQLKIVYAAAPAQGKHILGAVDKVLAKDRKNISALATKGRILADTGKTEKGMELLESALKLQPNNQEVAAALIGIYEASLEKRESAETRYRLGRLYFTLEQYDDAISMFQRTAQDYRTESDSGKMLGRCYVAKEIFDLAFAEFQKLVVDEEVKDLMYDLAKKYEAKQDINGAKNVYRQIFAADIGYKDVKARFEALSNPDSSNAMGLTGMDNYERTSVMQGMDEQAKRRYELLDELGRGAMGIVYKAKDRELEEIVALKILPDQLSENQEAVRRFKIEARNARKLSHPSIVRIHDIGEEGGKKYISMEFVDGSDLKKKVKTQGRFTLEEFFKYSIDIAGALDYAHTLGIVHRDIKPANIMLDVSDAVKVTDFGIAKLLDASNDVEGTMVGAVIGTPLYMSPEQVQGIPVDNRADIYAFGIMLYEFLNTRPPFTKGDLAYQHIHEKPTRIDDTPDEVWNIIAKCLEKDKEERWNRGDDIVEALKEARKKLLK